MNREAVLDRVATILGTNTTPAFARVYRGDRGRVNPGLAPGGAYACLWYAGEVEKTMSLGNVMVWERIGVRVYWARVIEEEPIEAQELELWDCTRNLQELLREDTTLFAPGGAGLTKQVDITPADVGWIGPVPQYTHRYVEFEMHLLETEAEATHG